MLAMRKDARMPAKDSYSLPELFILAAAREALRRCLHEQDRGKLTAVVSFWGFLHGEESARVDCKGGVA